MGDRIITKIERQQKARHRVNIYLDGEFAFGADEELVYAHRLEKGARLDPADVERLRSEDAYHKTRDAAMRFLARRKYGTQEMRLKLVRKGCDPAAVERVIDHLRSIALLDDAEFARAYVRDRRNLRPAGRRALEAELRKRGVGREIVSSVLQELADDASEELSARLLAGKYLARLGRLEPEARRVRLHRFLLRRGYDPDAVRRVVSLLLKEAGGSAGDPAFPEADESL